MSAWFIGRDPELAALRDAVDAGRFVAVVGPAGIGKSALVRAAVADRPHHLGGGLTMLLQRPYAALEAALRERLGGDPEEVAAGILHRLEGPLVVEDLHWVHDLTVEVLELLVEEAPVVVTARPEVAGPAQHLVGRAERIDLEPLPDRASERLSRRLHPDLTDGRRAELLGLAAGSPLLIERLVDRGQQVSPTLQAAVTERLRQLDEDGRRAVGLVALLGRPAEPELVSGDPGATDLLIEREDGRVDVRHAALASGIVALLDEDQRRDLHASLADRLVDAEGAAHDLAAGRAERAAMRAERAALGTHHAVERAELYRLAADAADTAGLVDGCRLRACAAEAFVDAGRWREAVDQTSRIVTDDPRLMADAELQEGRARWFAGEVDEARRLLDRAAASAGGHDEDRTTRIAVERAYLEVRDRVSGSVEVAREAVALAEAAGVEEVRARSTYGAALLYEGRPEWESVLKSALPHAVAQGDADLEATIAYHLVSGLGFHGRFPEAVDIGREQITRTRAAGLGRWTTHFEQAALIHRAVMTTDPAGVVDDADAHLERNRLFRNRYQVHLAKVLALLDLGRFDAARTAADALDAERGDAPEPAVALAAAWGELAWHLDDVDLAEDALALGRPVMDAYFGMHVLTERTAAHVLVAHGRPVDPRLPAFAMPTWWPALHELEGLRLLAAGEDEAGDEELRRAADEWEAMSIPRWAVRAGVAAAEAVPGDRTAPARRRHYVELGRTAGLPGVLRRLGHAVHPDLTPTEENVLRRVAGGATTRDVAASLGISPTTVDQHVESARRKLGAATRLEAALRVGS